MLRGEKSGKPSWRKLLGLIRGAKERAKGRCGAVGWEVARKYFAEGPA